MDVEKLIERLRNNNIENNCHDCALGYYAFEAATALSTLQDENAQLRAELEQVKAERDAAVERLREWEKFDIYLLAHNFLIPEKWCGIQKED